MKALKFLLISLWALPLFVKANVAPSEYLSKSERAMHKLHLIEDEIDNLQNKLKYASSHADRMSIQNDLDDAVKYRDSIETEYRLARSRESYPR